MRCQDALPLIEKLVDGEASPSERARVEAHLERCAPCRAHQRFLAGLPAAARAISLPEPPQAYWEALPGKVMARIEERRAASRRGFLAGLLSPARLRWAGALAAAVVAVVVGLQILTSPLYRSRQAPGFIPALKDSELETESQLKTQRSEPGTEESEVKTEADRSPLDKVKGLSPMRGQPERAPIQKQEKPGGPPGRLSADWESPRTQSPGSLKAPASERPKEPLPVAAAPAPSLETPLVTDSAATPSVPPAESEAMKQHREREQVETGLAGETQGKTAGKAILSVGPGATTPPATGASDSVAAPSPSSPAEEDLFRQGLEAERRGDKSSALESYRRLLERFPLGVHAPQARFQLVLSRAGRAEPNPDLADLEAERADWRDFVKRHPESGFVPEARYRLALCSIRIYELRRSEEDRQTAVEDGARYLGISPEGEKAEEIRLSLARLQR